MEEMVDYPFVSVIAPCRNEAMHVRSAITSILAGDYPADKMEVLLVDGMSTDGTRQIVAEMARFDRRVRVIDNPEKIVPVGMNRAIRESKGTYVVRIDCHSEFAGDYVRSCIETICRTGAQNVGGYVETRPGNDSAVARAIAVATSCRFGVGNSIFRLHGQEREVDTVPFGTFRADLFRRIGYYDERLIRNQDIELNQRIRRSGGKIVISPNIRLAYYNKATFAGLWSQSYQNGFWNPYTVWLTGGGLALRHFAPLFFVLGGILSLCATTIWPQAVWVPVSYFGGYLAAAVIAAVIAGRGKRVGVAEVLLAFLTLHFAYGCGSLWSIATVCGRHRDKRRDVAAQGP